MKVTELCSSGCLLETTKDFRKLFLLFIGSCLRQARNMEVVKVFGACRRQQMFWLVAKVKYSCGLIFEGGVLCVKN